MSERPQIAISVAEAIAEWAQIECVLAVSLAVILRTEAQAGLAILYSLTSTNNQMSVVSAAARHKLPASEEEIFSCILDIIRSAAKERHKLAHWCWALSDDLPDALLLLDPSHQAPLIANWLGLPNPLEDFDRSKIFVLRKKDAESTVKQIKAAKDLALKLMHALHVRDPKKRDPLFQRLSDEPQIHEALSRLRKARKSSRESP